ncbi:MAG: hypothetical protein EKK29_10090 [Hyphomicrobiales bacterium]|nr:MAG: hypothetical protein EKK29_10090 [Hyphomicrobiales bacterium]
MSDKLPELVWISKDSPEWPAAAQCFREEHRRSPPVGKRVVGGLCDRLSHFAIAAKILHRRRYYRSCKIVRP